ncbi:MAG TPA: hypothetical protein PLP34_06565, partial [Chitinophagaceae bacterium]|nr:hypothetical protein [Chitinophagaceae bacterium]
MDAKLLWCCLIFCSSFRLYAQPVSTHPALYLHLIKKPLPGSSDNYSLLDYPFYDTSDQVLYFAYAITPDKDFLPSVYLDLKIVPASRNNTR